MLSKTLVVERYLMDLIENGTLSANAPLPSQQQLMVRCGCSRTIVVRALEHLRSSGYIYSRKGVGSFVVSGGRSSRVREIVVIGERGEVLSLYPFSEILFRLDCGKLPVRWITERFANDNAHSFFVPGQAVIWLLPRESLLTLMYFLRSKGMPQLLVNRSYDDFDCVYTDALAGLREGLAHLINKAEREIAFISRVPDSSRPYLWERTIAFYEACLAVEAKLSPDAVFRRTFSNPPGDFAEIGRELFRSSRSLRGIFAMEHDLVPYVLMTASQYGLTPGKDYFLLTFDTPVSIGSQKGIITMVQPMEFFRQSIEQWLQLIGNKTEKRLVFREKTTLVSL